MALVKLIKQTSHSVVVHRLPAICLRDENELKDAGAIEMHKQLEWVNYARNSICSVMRVHQSKLSLLTKKKFILFYEQNKHK
jgi:hypothetical protein